ncbi:unnamed protein product [Blepharisma stoltei]|uniref:Uncharacterized protein n=1 Tax=Blepharisma stoltei TaxID=1481888 RepID=A0AAU9JU57_9CILI|nr:unnamed protein product [Blepharisma stoltei]
MGCCDSRPEPVNQVTEKAPIKRPKFKRKTRFLKPQTQKTPVSSPLQETRTPRRSTPVVSRGSFILNVPESLKENYAIIKKLHDNPNGIVAIARDKRTNMQRLIKEVRWAKMEWGESEKFMERVDSLKDLVKIM